MIRDSQDTLLRPVSSYLLDCTAGEYSTRQLHHLSECLVLVYYCLPWVVCSGIANLLDIYATTSELPPQKEDWELPPSGPLIVPMLPIFMCWSCDGSSARNDCSTGAVLVMGGRNVAAKIQGKEGIGLDWETVS